MVVNVAQLLKSDVGTSRIFFFEEVLQPFGEVAETVAPIKGTAELIRINRGILVRGQFSTAVDLECSRCLSIYVEMLNLEFAEEFVPVVDIHTGAPVKLPRDEETFLINEKHELDLTPAIREYGLLALPMKPLCQDDCQGLCPRCGVNRNYETCACVLNEPDERFAVLRALLSDENHPSS
ncbi:MAG TPA: DUF177 domain-containing protein [Chloroflexota bacterium]|nr:DUF177 domain-containing protein [Chloroflexota bacterium]